MEAPAEVKDVEMYESVPQEVPPENRAPTSPLKRERSSSSPESPQSDYPPGQRMRTSGGVKTELECNQCGVTFRKHSDLKKHNARHSRQYRCVEDNCPRAQIGFATINDLYRHEKSVHGKHVGKSRSYKCFAPGCAKASKLWPRLDNFKQHLIRMHPNEELDALVKKSEQWHADEEEAEASQGLSNTQESAISALQNVKRLRSPPHPSSQGPLMSPTENGVGRRWDLTPPTNVIGHGPRPAEVRPFTDPLPPRPLPLNSVPNNQGTPTPTAADPNREILQRPPEQPPLIQQGQLPPQQGPLSQQGQLLQQGPLSQSAQLTQQSQISQQGPLPLHGQLCQQSQQSQQSQLSQQGQLPQPDSQQGQLPPHPVPPAPPAPMTTTTTTSATPTTAAAPSADIKPANHVATETTSHREVGPRPEQLARVIHNTEEPGPVMQPDDTREISRVAEVRELAPEARCLSCQHYNRRCYMDQSNPWQCVACPSAQHCIFRRTVVREGPTSSFSWAELVGIQNLARKAT